MPDNTTLKLQISDLELIQLEARQRSCERWRTHLWGILLHEAISTNDERAKDLATTPRSLSIWLKDTEVRAGRPTTLKERFFSFHSLLQLGFLASCAMGRITRKLRVLSSLPEVTTGEESKTSY